MPTNLSDLPPELVEEILVRCDPMDVARASMTCRKVYEVVYGTLLTMDSDMLQPCLGSHDANGLSGSSESGRRKVLWREMYLNQPLDDLRRCINWLGIPRGSNGSLGEEEIDWEKELQSIIRARTVVSDLSACRGEQDLKDVLRTLLRLVEWVPPLGNLALNLLWVPATLKEFLDLVERGVPSFPSPNSPCIADKESPRSHWKLPPKAQWAKETKQLHAQLHTLYGLTRRDLTMTRRVESRAWVYDMRKYTPENEYGPLRNGAKYVDWEFLERIHHVMSMHIVWDEHEGEGQTDQEDVMKKPGFEYITYPMSMHFTQVMYGGDEVVRDGEEDNVQGYKGKGVRYVPSTQIMGEHELPDDADWASIGGTWGICFCFCDHRELIDFNKSADTSGRLDISLFEDEEYVEVFRRIEVNLKVTRVENDPEHPGRPMIGFVGEMRPPSMSTMYGVVQLTMDNHMKWQFYSGEVGNGAVWSSVGIQVGGVGSSYGVLGSWTTVFHDEDDPVGPFWMQKQ